MEMEEVPHDVSYQSLLEAFEVTRKELGETEDTIKRITGRDLDTFPNGIGGPNKWKNQQGQFANRVLLGRKRPLFPIIKPKDEIEHPEEESPDEDDIPSKKPSLQSTVVATPKDVKSRKDSIQEQNSNSKVKARNRRMFGMILGTLQKFQHDAKKKTDKDLKRAEIEQKVEAAAAEEKERIKKEKEQLFHNRKEKQIQLRCLEKKLEIAELHETWEKSQKNLVHFIRTEANPPIFFLPAKHNTESEKRLEESKNKVLELLSERKQKMEKDITEVEEWYKKDNFPIDKENIGPVEEDEVPDLEMPDPALVDEEIPVTQNESTDVMQEERTNESFVENSESNMENSESNMENNESNMENNETNMMNNESNMENMADQEFEPIYD